MYFEGFYWLSTFYVFSVCNECTITPIQMPYHTDELLSWAQTMRCPCSSLNSKMELWMTTELHFYFERCGLYRFMLYLITNHDWLDRMLSRHWLFKDGCVTLMIDGNRKSFLPISFLKLKYAEIRLVVLGRELKSTFKVEYKRKTLDLSEIQMKKKQTLNYAQ